MSHLLPVHPFCPAESLRIRGAPHAEAFNLHAACRHLMRYTPAPAHLTGVILAAIAGGRFRLILFHNTTFFTTFAFGSGGSIFNKSSSMANVIRQRIIKLQHAVASFFSGIPRRLTRKKRLVRQRLVKGFVTLRPAFSITPDFLPVTPGSLLRHDASAGFAFLSCAIRYLPGIVILPLLRRTSEIASCSTDSSPAAAFSTRSIS